MFSLFIAPIALAWTLVSAERYAFSSSSMAPNVLAGDVVTGWRHPLGFSRYSYQSFALPIEGRLLSAPPQRGDIVSIRKPHQPQSIGVERVVGMPGERIQMIGGVLHIEGRSVRLESLGRYEIASEGNLAAMVQMETLPEGRSYKVLNIEDETVADDTREFLVPAESYFMLGDNRDNSNDSRFQLGFVPAENLIAVIESPR